MRCDRSKPSSESLHFSELGSFAPSSQESLLGDIFASLKVTGLAVHQRCHHVLVTFHQFTKGRRIPLLSRKNELGFLSIQHRALSVWFHSTHPDSTYRPFPLDSVFPP